MNENKILLLLFMCFIYQLNKVTCLVLKQIIEIFIAQKHKNTYIRYSYIDVNNITYIYIYLYSVNIIITNLCQVVLHCWQ